jgi:hypothetical protein
MFIKNLVEVKAKKVLEEAIVLHVNLGEEGALSKDLRSLIVESIENQLYERYDIDIKSSDFVKSVYNQRLERFRDSPKGQLYDVDREAYRKEEIKILEDLMQDEVEHLKKCIRHLVKGRNRHVVVFIDNADQRSDETQERAFLVAQEFASKWLASVFLALRPETYHNSLESGTLSGYQPRVFTISPPRVDKVLKKRLEFALRIASGELPFGQNLSEVSSYVELHGLQAILKSFLHSLRVNEDLIRSIDNLSGGNIREALSYVRTFLGSAHVNTEKISDIQMDKGSYTVPVHELLRAIIYKNTKYFDPSRSPIMNMFDIRNNEYKNHFLTPIALSIINAKSHSQGEGTFCRSKEIYHELQDIGYTTDYIDRSLSKCYAKNLLRTSGKTGKREVDSDPYSMRITTKGAYHVKHIIKKFQYLDAVVIDTPIIDEDIRKNVHVIKDNDINRRLKRADKFLNYLDRAWSRSSVNSIYFDWGEESKKANMEINEIKRR